MDGTSIAHPKRGCQFFVTLRLFGSDSTREVPPELIPVVRHIFAGIVADQHTAKAPISAARRAAATRGWEVVK